MRFSPSVLKDPAFALYLAAVALLGVKWLSPLGIFYERALLFDLIIAAATATFVLTRGLPRPRAFHWALIAYIAAGSLSLAFAADLELGAKTVLLMCELAVLAVLTSEFARDPVRLNAIGWAVVTVTAYTALLAVLGLALFYLDVNTSLLGAYGKLAQSDDYARIAAGFQSGPLLGSFCIGASAIVAHRGVALPPRVRTLTQVVLAALVLLTFSRAVIGFAAAWVIRVGFTPSASLRMRLGAATVVVGSVALIAALSVGRLTVEPTRVTETRYEVPAPSGRRENAIAGFETFIDDPLTGRGPGTLTGRDLEWRPHLTALNVAATMGVPALIAGTTVLVVVWRRRKRPTDLAVWGGLAGLAIDGLAQDVDHFRHVWLLIGLADADREERGVGGSGFQAKGGVEHRPGIERD